MSSRHPNRTKSMIADEKGVYVCPPRLEGEEKGAQANRDPAEPGLVETPLGEGSSSDVSRSPHGARPSPTVGISPGSLHSRDRIPSSLRQRDRERYHIVAEHGRGGLGRVYRAYDKELCRDVALKELLQPTCHSELRFIREARITARLEHPGIVPVHEAGRWPDGTPFYSMKLVAGRPLSSVIADAKTLDRRLALLPHLIAVADAIAYAHDHRIIHRDLKPSNVIIGEFGETIVIDWGLAKDLTESTEEAAVLGPYRTSVITDVTVTGSVLGTPAYMSPEQARGEQADIRSDVYSIGAMLFQLCTAKPPAKTAAPTELRKELRHIPDDLATIILKALSSAQKDRYPNAGAFASDLRAFDTGARIAARDYSLAAMLAHWVRNNRRLASTVTVSATIFLILGGIALREIVLRGHRARVAQHDAEEARGTAEKERAVAEEERDVAIRAQAAMLLETDPTKARDLLASRDVLGPQEALLLARAHGAGTADHIIALRPFKIHDALPDSDLEKLVIAAADNKLRSINLATGSVVVLDDKLIEPPFVVAEENGEFTYMRRGSNGPELVRSGAPASATPFEDVKQLPISNTVASVDGLYLLGRGSDLALLSATAKVLPIERGIRGIAPYRDGILACTGGEPARLPGPQFGELIQVAQGHVVARLGPCRHDGGWRAFATSPNGYVVQASSSKIVIQRGTLRYTASIPEPNEFVMSISGLVVGSDGSGRGWYLLPGSTEKTEGPSSESKVMALGADGRLAAWGYSDGLARVRDVDTGVTWTLIGHGGPIDWIFVSNRLRRIVTVGGPEVRVWRIPPFSFRPIGKFPRGAHQGASSPDGRWVAFDGSDGTISVVERDNYGAGVQPLHRHNSTAYGVTWRYAEACSAGWDGRVMCTDVTTRRTRIIAEHAQPARFVHAVGKVLAYTVEDGGVWAHVPGQAQSQLLYRHDAEPFRVAVNALGDVASGGVDGSVMLYDAATSTVHRAIVPHTHRVYQIKWRGDELFTSSYDGTIRTWTKDLTVSATAHAGHPVRDLEPLQSGWIANVGATRLWLHKGSTDLTFETGPMIRDLSVSTDGRFAGAVVNGDLVIYDLSSNKLAAARTGDAGAHCVHFVDNTRMLVCESSGELLSISADTMPFVSLSNNN